MKNKIIIEDGFSTDNKTGVGQYTLMLENILKDIGYDIIHINKNFLLKIKNKIIRRFFYNIWLNTFFILKAKKYKTIAIFTNFAVPVFKLTNIKYISVIHDLCSIIHPEYNTKINNLYNNLNIKNAIRKSDKIITVSNTIKKEILNTFNLQLDINVVNSSTTTGLDKIEIIENNVLHNLGINQCQYILSVATNNKRKNVDLLIKSFKKIENEYENLKLILVGSGYKKNISSKNIISTGYISDRTLKILYQHALLYVFPSLYEGFGTPILDAQYFGVPIVCSDIPVFYEVGQDSVEFFSHSSEDDLIRKVKLLVNDESSRENLIQKGHNNIQRYDINLIKKQLIDMLNTFNEGKSQ